MMTISTQARRVPLDRLLLFCWYLTVLSAPFGDCLLRVALPIGGHFFLFRGMILLTCAVYLVYLFHRRENPFRGLSRSEGWFVVLAVSMLCYGGVSVFRAASLGAWFSKFFTMCQMFALVFLFLKLGREQTVLRNTVALLAVSSLICMLGGAAEMFHGPFFDTPYRNAYYPFWGHWMYSPIFTFYNPNGFSAYLLFVIEILYLYLAFRWEKLPPRSRTRAYWGVSCAFALMLILCCADGGRLCILSIPLFAAGVIAWALAHYRKGLLLLVLLAAALTFTYVGENYEQVKYKVDEAVYQVQEILHPDADSQEKPETPPEPEKNQWGTLYTVVPSVTGENVNESLTESDGIRMTLLKDCAQMIRESRGLGIGLGNVESRLRKMDNSGGIYAAHCFIMEVLAEFGIFALLPLALVIFSILRRLLLGFGEAVKAKNWTAFARLFLLLMTCAAFPLLSTANSSSWGITSMWLYLAMLLLCIAHFSKDICSHIEGSGSHRRKAVHE